MSTSLIGNSTIKLFNNSTISPQVLRQLPPL
jgi:hypothetical protein